MADDRVSRVSLKYEVDQSSLRSTEQSIAEFRQQLLALDAANKEISSSAQKAGSQVKSSFGDADTSAIRRLREEMGELADEGERVQKVSKFSVGLEGLRRTGSALNQIGLGDVGRPIQVAGDVGQVGKEITEVAGAIAAMEVPMAALLAVAGPVAIAIGAVVAVFAAVKKQADDAVESEKRRYDAEKQRLELQNSNIQKGRTETADQNVQNQRDLAAAISNTSDLIAKKLKQIADADRQYADLGQSVNPGKRNELGALGLQLQKELQELKTQRDKLIAQYGNEGTALADQVKIHEQARDAIKDLDDELQRELRTEQLRRSGASVKQVQELFDAASQEAASIRDRIPALEASAKASEEGEAALQKYQERLNSLNKDLVEYQKLLDEAKGKQAAINVIKDIITLPGRVVKAVETSDLKKAIDKQVQDVVDRDNRVAAIQDKFNKDTEAADQRAADRKGAINQKYIDASIAAAERLQDASAAAERKLQQQKDDLLAGLQRDLSKGDREALDKEYDDQLKSHRDEQKALTEHLQRLKEIRDNDQLRLQQDQELLDRNFLGLLQDKLRQQIDTRTENTNFNNRQGELQESQRQEVEDLRTSVERQRRERLISYDNALSDARLAYRREISQAEDARRIELQRAADAKQRDIVLLNNALTQETNIRVSSYQQQLKIAALYGQAFIDAERKRQEALLTQARTSLLTATVPQTQYGGTRTLARRALGGPVEPGQLYLVNDRDAGQRESVNGVSLPGGLGYYIPLQRGNVSAGGSGGGNNNHLTQNIYEAHNPAVTARIAREQVIDFFEKANH